MSSKFAGVLNAKREPQAIEETPEPPKKVSRPVAPPSGAVGRPRGHAGGKSSHPDYTGTTAYIRKTTHDSVKIALIREGQGREYSELVEELLTSWLDKRPAA